jgi:hypothetical protein
VRAQSGVTLIEAVLALAILAGICGGAAAAIAAGRVVATQARHEAVAVAMAGARLGELQSLAFTIGPETTAPELGTTPADALWRDRDGCVDYLDAAGRALGSGAASRRAAAYVRRWRIGRRGAGGSELAVLAVLVAPMAEAERAAASGDPRTLAGRRGVIVVRGALARRAS